MVEKIDETAIIAWVDGELGEAEAARVASLIAADPALAALAERHRAMKARFAAAFGPIAEQPATAPVSAQVIPLAPARARRQATRPMQGWWTMGGAIAASLLAGVLVGHGIGGSPGAADGARALALSPPITRALDDQLSGDGGAIRVALSFKDRDGHYCRSFVATALSGVACRESGDWQLRYAARTAAQKTDYRMAGADAAQAAMVAAMIDGDPLDRAGEAAARKAGWR